MDLIGVLTLLILTDGVRNRLLRISWACVCQTWESDFLFILS